MIPTVEECTVEVPGEYHDYKLLREGGREGNMTIMFDPFLVNKKSTKFITMKKTIPNVNLRGMLHRKQNSISLRGTATDLDTYMQVWSLVK